MARIAFITWPISVGTNSALNLARDLRSRGHEIVCLGVPNCEQFVAPHAFPFVPLYERWLPHTQATPPSAPHRFWEQLRVWRSAVREVSTLLNAIERNREREFQEVLARISPDLLVIYLGDFEAIIPSLLAFEAGIKCIYLNDTYGNTENACMPPVRSGIVPGESATSTLRSFFAWKRLKLQRYASARVFGMLGLSFDGALYRASRQIAARCGYPWSSIESTDTVFLKALLPELVLCPRELDFPHVARPGRYYLGSNLDFNREQAAFPWDALDSRPLIYCALGTLVWFDTAAYRRFFDVLLKVAATKQTYQWVVALCDSLDPSELGPRPPNAILVKQAPQLALLQRSTIAIVHGGTNTVIECANSGVPMVVFPLGFDHPGNAARVVYHGLGVQGKFSSVTPEKLMGLVDRVERDPFIQIQARLMREKLRRGSVEGSAVDFVEKLLWDRTVAQPNAEPGHHEANSSVAKS